MSSLENRMMARRGFLASLGTWLVWLALPVSLFRRTGLQRPRHHRRIDEQRSTGVIVTCDPDAVQREVVDHRRRTA
jgi:hypothetical protein